MSVSLIVVTGLILLVMFGVGQKILDNMRLNDKSALVILIAICIGLVIPPIWIGEYFCFSIGGFLLPLAIAIYMLFSCGKSDLLRCLFGTILVAGLIYGLEWILPADPEEMIIDNTSQVFSGKELKSHLLTLNVIIIDNIEVNQTRFVKGASKSNLFSCFSHFFA